MSTKDKYLLWIRNKGVAKNYRIIPFWDCNTTFNPQPAGDDRAKGKISPPPGVAAG